MSGWLFALLAVGLTLSPTTSDNPSVSIPADKHDLIDKPVTEPGVVSSEVHDSIEAYGENLRLALAPSSRVMIDSNTEGFSYAQESDEEDFTFDAGGDARSSNWLTDNLRVSIDLLTRFETTKERDQDGWLHAIGLDIHKVFSDESGDIGTLLFQPYAARRDSLPLPPHVDEDHRWEFEAHDIYFNLTRFGQGRTNVRVGHFDVPFGLEPIVDTHFRLRQLVPMQNLGTKKDWGVSLNGAFSTFDYEVALTRGSGIEFIDKGENFVVAGRIGTPADENFIIGVSAMYAEIIDPMKVMRYRMGLPMAQMMLFIPPDDIIRRHRIGVDVTSIQGQFTLRGELSAGQDFDQDVIVALGDVEWTNPDGTWKAWVQTLYWSQDATNGWDADLTVRTGVAWKYDDQWTLSAQLVHDFESYLNGVTDTIFTVQLRWTF